MKSYVVGGAVRDRLLGLAVSDRDHVVVGSTVDEMLAAGYRAVGKDFPVFLHPTTHEEYALARTERKVAKGYAGFVFHADPTVTLAADLERRDLTINAIAEDASTGELIDPFGGQRDLASRTLRHVGPAFVEDPVRALRVARFAARFVDFELASETEALIRTMTERGEIDALVPERVWQEIARGLMEARPSRMFALLRRTGALRRIAPEIDAAFDHDTGLPDRLDCAAGAEAPLEVRFGLIACAIPPDAASAIVAVCNRLAVPRACREIALLAAAERAPMLAALAAGDAARLVGTMERCDAYRRSERFAGIREVVALTVADPADRERFEERLRRAADAALGIDASAIARSVDYVPERVAAALRDARVNTVAHVLASS